MAWRNKKDDGFRPECQGIDKTDRVFTYKISIDWFLTSLASICTAQSKLEEICITMRGRVVKPTIINSSSLSCILIEGKVTSDKEDVKMLSKINFKKMLHSPVIGAPVTKQNYWRNHRHNLMTYQKVSLPYSCQVKVVRSWVGVCVPPGHWTLYPPLDRD